MNITRTPHWRLQPLALASLALIAGLAQAPDAAQRRESSAATPVPGIGVPKDQVPSNVQTISDRGCARRRA
jgi:iron complex outermembrane receptor protein